MVGSTQKSKLEQYGIHPGFRPRPRLFLHSLAKQSSPVLEDVGPSVSSACGHKRFMQNTPGRVAKDLSLVD